MSVLRSDEWLEALDPGEKAFTILVEDHHHQVEMTKDVLTTMLNAVDTMNQHIMVIQELVEDIFVHLASEDE